MCEAEPSPYTKYTVTADELVVCADNLTIIRSVVRSVIGVITYPKVVPNVNTVSVMFPEVTENNNVSVVSRAYL